MDSVSTEHLRAFKAIADFITTLADAFGDQSKSLQLYAHLIRKTTLMHKKPIIKHINAFRDFCITNRENIENRSQENLPKKQIIYSLKVFIDIPKIFAVADKKEKNLIWDHLLNISSILDPAGKAKNILNKSKGGKENEFLTNIISKVEQNVDPNADPMEAVGNIMKSGIFTELVGNMGDGLEKGDLDLNKLLGTVQTMVSTFSNTDEENGEMPNDILQTMMSSIAAGAQNMPVQNEDGTMPPPDLSNIASMLGPMMNNLNIETPSLESSIDQQLENAKKDGKL
jgi:hypothetical protein